MDKILIKTVTKTKGEDTEDVTKTFLTNGILKKTPSKQLFIAPLRTSEENAKNNGRNKGSC